MDRRLRKVRILNIKENVRVVDDLQARLMVKDHINRDLFGEKDLHSMEYEGEGTSDASDKKRKKFNRASSSRLTGVFVSGSAVNLSRRSLTEYQIGLVNLMPCYRFGRRRKTTSMLRPCGFLRWPIPVKQNLYIYKRLGNNSHRESGF